MKKFLLLTLFAMLTSMSIYAQSSSMSDSQILDFVQKQQQMGVSQQQIAIKLVQKGVNVQRLQKLRKKMAQLNGGQNSLGAKDLGVTIDRSRTANAVTQRDDNSTTLSSGRIAAVPTTGAIDPNSPEMQAMTNELNGFAPDSTEIFRRQMEVLYANKRKVFGRDIFNNQMLSFEPNMNIATPQNYVLGPGDKVFVDIYGASQKTIEATVSPDGDITIEGFGPVSVSGLTVSKASERLRSQLGQRYSSSSIKLTVGQTRTIMVNVMGEVVVPGTYTLSAFSSVFHALYMAGGVNDIGTLRAIKVYRNNKLVSTVDIYDYILNGKLTGNVRLADNDVIVVGPYDCLVNITGKVKRPMFYELKKGESLGTLLKYSGGFTGDAYTNSVRVVRKAGKEYSVWNVAEFDMNTFTMNDEDSVGVDSVTPRFENMVELRGAALRPGMYQLGGGVTTVRDLMNVADGLKEEAFTDHVVMHRLREDRSLEVLSLNLTDIMNGKEADVPLKNGDVLFIPSKEEQNNGKMLAIYGEVYYPGQYQYAEGMTVEDFILQAGGLKENALTNRVTVSRRVATPVTDTTDKDSKKKKKNKNDNEDLRAENVQTFEINLKEGFAIDGNDGFKLQPFDEVYVGKIPGLNEQIHVVVSGEANYRGPYALKMKNARLSDVVRQAGGLTTAAWAHGARIIRKMDDKERARRQQLVNDIRVYDSEVVVSTNVNIQPTGTSLVDTLLQQRYMSETTYVVGIELDKALDNPGSDYDVALRDGDILDIPQFDPTVKITGQVNEPGSSTYIKGKTAKYYINQAGGIAGRGWSHHAYVIYKNGTIKRVGRGAEVEPGCEVVVPTRPIKNSSTTWISAVSSLASVATTIVALLISVLN